jgi:hypothetical protein
MRCDNWVRVSALAACGVSRRRMVRVVRLPQVLLNCRTFADVSVKWDQDFMVLNWMAGSMFLANRILFRPSRQRWSGWNDWCVVFTGVCLDRADNGVLAGMFSVSYSQGVCLDRVDNIELNGIFGVSHSRVFCLERVMTLHWVEWSMLLVNTFYLDRVDNIELDGMFGLSY